MMRNLEIALQEKLGLREYQLKKLKVTSKNENYLILIQGEPCFVLKIHPKHLAREKKVLEFFRENKLLTTLKPAYFGEDFMITQYESELKDIPAFEAIDEIVEFHTRSLHHGDFTQFATDKEFFNEKRNCCASRILRHPDLVENLWKDKDTLLTLIDKTPPESYQKMPKIIVHGDLFRKNILKRKDREVIFIDYEIAFYDVPTWDLARAILDTPLENTDYFVAEYVTRMKDSPLLENHTSSEIIRAVWMDCFYRIINDSIGMQQHESFRGRAGKYLEVFRSYLGKIIKNLT